MAAPTAWSFPAPAARRAPRSSAGAADATGLPTPVTIPASLEPGSPTVVIHAETGERVPHWSEYDVSHGDDARRAFMVRPAVRLEPDCNGTEAAHSRGGSSTK